MAVLAADLTFFLFFPTRLPNYYNQIFQSLPWADTVEKTFLLIIGLVIALVVGILLVRMIMKSLFKSIQRGFENE